MYPVRQPIMPYACRQVSVRHRVAVAGRHAMRKPIMPYACRQVSGIHGVAAAGRQQGFVGWQ